MSFQGRATGGAWKLEPPTIQASLERGNGWLSLNVTLGKTAYGMLAPIEPIRLTSFAAKRDHLLEHAGDSAEPSPH
jgi:hypothetical protein